jgi:tetratricopeptide (TPR) repeat protein
MTEIEGQQLEHACQLREQGNYKDALAELHTLAETLQDPIDKAGVLLNAVTCLEMLGELEQAKTELKTAKTLLLEQVQSPKDTHSDDNEATSLQIDIGLEEAVLNRAEGKVEEAMVKLGDLLSRFGKHLRQSAHRDAYQNIQVQRGSLLADLGRWRDALPILEEADSFAEPRAFISFYLGYCYVAIGDDHRGKEKLIEALKIGLPKYLEFRAHCALGKAYHKLEDYVSAKEELERCAQTADKRYIAEAKLWKWLEITCLHLGLKDEANQYAELARAS